MKIPLLDGTTIDTERHPYPPFAKRKTPANATVLETDFAEGKNPWWLTPQLDTGASQSFSGLSSGNTTTTLSTGTNSIGTQATLAGPTIDYSNWAEVNLIVYGAVTNTDAGKLAYYGLRPSPDTGDGFLFQDTNGGYTYAGVHGYGSASLYIPKSIANHTTPHNLAWRMYDNQTPNSQGHSFDFTFNGQHYDSSREARKFPDPQDLTFHFGIETEDTATDRTLTIDGIRIELIPYKPMRTVPNDLIGSLVAHWTMDDTDVSNSTIIDVTGNGHDLTINGELYSRTAPIGEGRQFSGAVDAYAHGSALPVTSKSVTISAWMNVGTVKEKVPITIEQPDGGTRTKNYLYIDGSNNQIAFDQYEPSGNEIAGGAVSTGTWTHIAISVSNSKRVLYQDGKPVASDTSPESYKGQKTSKFYLATRRDKGNTSEVILDEVRVYDRALNETEVSALYREGE